ncbi:hypothetical protein BDA99DRAFT_543917 [Phascolomyces articulosus]|uniref:Secreted protein n=1 Tax=Phascolomyces articulosus TaxID=60185 RepID=A0AAD5JLP0_9FUNG|nr:hypothetical protein BDA99DRAFT_543917 [Phascolomyces articulosus]
MIGLAGKSGIIRKLMMMIVFFLGRGKADKCYCNAICCEWKNKSWCEKKMMRLEQTGTMSDWIKGVNSSVWYSRTKNVRLFCLLFLFFSDYNTEVKNSCCQGRFLREKKIHNTNGFLSESGQHKANRMVLPKY